MAEFGVKGRRDLEGVVLFGVNDAVRVIAELGVHGASQGP
jgi:hypothetical protein